MPGESSQAPQLSVVMITKNAARYLDDVLSAVDWAGEIVLLDSGSSDETLAIAARHGARCFSSHDWPGFGEQKNRALAAATGEWVLSLDADEVVSPRLKESILQAMTQPDCPAWRCARLSSFCGQWIHHSGWRPDYILRLFRRGHAQFSADLVHERLIVQEGSVGTLDGDLLHYSYADFEEVLAKANHYSSLAARMRQQKGEVGGLGKAILKGFWAFIRTYLLRAGFLDGRYGFILAIYNAETTYYRYLKLMHLQSSANLSRKE